MIMSKIFVTSRSILIQIVIFIVLLGIVEGVFLLMEDSFKKPPVGLQLIVHPYPYIMFGADAGSGAAWLDIFTNKVVPSKISFNNYGFSETYDYTMNPDAEYLKRHGRKPGERIVLITGGSVVHGVGATGNDRTIAGRLQHHLNKGGRGARYRVVNIGMGGWIAYQQFLGLSLFGLPLKPDWVVVMDGHNDAAVACVHGSGVANPLGWPRMLNLSQGTGTASNRLFRTLKRHSALVRVIAGEAGVREPVNAPGVVFDEKDPEPRFRLRMAGLTFGEHDRQMEFYLQAQRNVLALFSGSNVILSSQPVMYNNAITPAYRSAFSPDGTEREAKELTVALDKYMSEHSSDRCSSAVSSQSLGYFMARSALKLNDLVADRQVLDRSRHVFYVNTEWSMPMPEELRKPFFVDNAHLSDLGQDRVGELFAEVILSLESGKKFDYATFVRKRSQ